MDIESVWEWEVGDYKDGKFINKHIRKTETKTLKLKLEERIHGKVIRFIGGPTGFESYYIECLNLKPGPFVICGGTINSWPRCTVKAEDIIKFLNSGVE